MNMQPFMFSSMNMYLKNIKMKTKFEIRKKNNYENTGDKFGVYRQQAEQVRKSKESDGIMVKLKSGQPLTPAELEYLRRNNPQMYEKAKQIISERAEYRNQLRSCKTKDEAAALKTQKAAQLAQEVKTVASNPALGDGAKLAACEFIQMRASAAEAEYKSFSANEGRDLEWQYEISKRENDEKQAAIDQETEKLEKDEQTQPEKTQPEQTEQAHSEQAQPEQTEQAHSEQAQPEQAQSVKTAASSARREETAKRSPRVAAADERAKSERAHPERARLGRPRLSFADRSGMPPQIAETMAAVTSAPSRILSRAHKQLDINA